MQAVAEMAPGGPLVPSAQTPAQKVWLSAELYDPEGQASTVPASDKNDPAGTGGGGGTNFRTVRSSSLEVELA